ncbi:MAG: hypothetical protein DDT19_02640 [Syntrophomonadaceae bacterium]|nr:hypothetical protein [Bacillota bacterium]
MSPVPGPPELWILYRELHSHLVLARNEAVAKGHLELLSRKVVRPDRQIKTDLSALPEIVKN